MSKTHRNKDNRKAAQQRRDNRRHRREFGQHITMQGTKVRRVIKLIDSVTV
jgi:hypothetical protein